MSNKPSDKQKSKPAPKPGAPVPKSASEGDILAQQAVDAKAAITRTLSQIGTDLGTSLSPGTWTKTHPWLTLGATTALGFIATAVLIPSKEDLALRKLAKIERALNPPPPPRERDTNGEADRETGAKGYKTGRSSFTRSLLGEVLKAVQPALLSMLTAGVTASAARPSQEEMQAAAAAGDQETTPQL